MARDEERIERIKDALRAADLDAMFCVAPEDVLLVSGYWPVVGNALAIVTREGEVRVAAPQDERELARRGRADSLQTFSPGSLDALVSTHEAATGALERAICDLRLGRIGFVGGSSPSQAPTQASITTLWRGRPCWRMPVPPPLWFPRNC